MLRLSSALIKMVFDDASVTMQIFLSVLIKEGKADNGRLNEGRIFFADAF